MHTYMHDILQNVNECKHRVHTDPKDPGWAAPASRQVLACQEAGSGASRIASPRNHPYLREHVCPEHTGSPCTLCLHSIDASLSEKHKSTSQQKSLS